MTIVLASGSPARAGLLRAAGVAFETVPANIDETFLRDAARAGGSSASDAAKSLAEAKALAVAAIRPRAMVIGADQILALDRVWFAKPADHGAAASQLRALRGRRHTLHTAVCAVRDSAILWTHVEVPALTMRQFSEAALATYLRVEGDRVLATVGGYRIEGPGMTLFDAIEGDFTAILGLPMLPLLAFLRRSGLMPE